MATPLHPLHAQVSSALQSRHHISVDPEWLNTFLTSRGPHPPPLPALISTAHFRILASDITTSIATTTTTTTTAETGSEASSSSCTFPEDAADVAVRDRRLQGHVIVQVLDVHDVGSSKFSQIEAIERVERGEEIRGREVIRSVAVDEDNSNPTASSSSSTGTGTGTGTSKLTSGPHRLVVQDAKGTRMVALEVEKVPRVGVSVSAGAKLPASVVRQSGGGGGGGGGGANTSNSGTVVADDPGMFIGCKLLLRPGTVIRRGMVILTPDKCVVMGGKVEAWDRKWKEGRKGRLISLLAEENSNANSNGAAGGG
jgi:RecQ-mediated genome instability protein 1